MKNRATLSLIELVIMLLVFVTVAALCLNAFVWADEVAANSENSNQAMLHLQNAAELLKACEGDMAKAAELYGGIWDGKSWHIFYDENWMPVKEGGSFVLQAELLPQETELLGAAEISIFADNECLLSIKAGWQEVMPDA